MKPIRLPYLSLLLLLTLPLLAPFCSTKNGDPVPDTHPATVAGTWGWKNLLVSPPVDDIDDILDFYVQLNLLTSKCLPLLDYEFRADGTLIPIQQTICPGTGLSPAQYGPRTGDKWAVNGSRIIITHTDGSKDEADLELTDSTLPSGAKVKAMIWKRPMDGRKYTWKFVRSK